MIKICLYCRKEKEMRSNQKYCDERCKKNYENHKRPTRRDENKENKPPQDKSFLTSIKCPEGLNEIAAAYWNKIAPLVIKRGHLNVISEDAFEELCDLRSRLKNINTMINNGTSQNCSKCGNEIKISNNRSLLQSDDNGVESFKESALSDLKRKYSKQFLDYCKEFYLTPLSNRGDFGIDGGESKDPEDDFLNMGKR